MTDESETSDNTYLEGKIKSQTQTTEINEGKWKSILRHEVLDVVDRTNENGKSLVRSENVKLHARGMDVAHPNITSKLPRLMVQIYVYVNIGRIEYRNQFYLNANANFAGLGDKDDVS